MLNFCLRYRRDFLKILNESLPVEQEYLPSGNGFCVLSCVLLSGGLGCFSEEIKIFAEKRVSAQNNCRRRGVLKIFKKLKREAFGGRGVNQHSLYSKRLNGISQVWSYVWSYVKPKSRVQHHYAESSEITLSSVHTGFTIKYAQDLFYRDAGQGVVLCAVTR